MSELKRVQWRWTAVRGHSLRAAPQTLPEDLAQMLFNVVLVEGTLGRRRLAFSAIDLTGGPASVIHYLAVYRPTTSAPRLFAFSSDTALAVHSWTGTSWTAHALSDTPDSGPQTPCALTFNNKLFIAYNSSVNRLHVYDGTSIRRVGLAAAALPTVANTGAGTYPAIYREYRVQFLIKSGSDVQAMSELSASAGFIPSGTELAARVTRPAPADSIATHWRLYGHSQGAAPFPYDLFEQVGSDLPIATTFYDDSQDPTTYSGAQPPALGTNIPPPSVKYLATDGNRLLMAGAYEATEAAGETTPKTSRVWFTRVLGSSDLGDDESIPDTIDQRNWIDVGENDGDPILGLSQPVEGLVYVFKSHSIYRLLPTGIDTLPYRAELVSAQVGLCPAFPESHRTIVAVAGVVYFQGWSGLYRLSPTEGLDQVGWDITDRNNMGPATVGACWADAFQQLVLLRHETAFEGPNFLRHYDVFHPDFARRTADGMRGGWVLWSSNSLRSPRALATFEYQSGATTFITKSAPSSQFRYIFVGGAQGGVPTLQVFNRDNPTDPGDTEYEPTIVSHAHTIGVNFSVYEPILEIAAQTAAATVPQVAYVADYGRELHSMVSPSLVATVDPSILLPLTERYVTVRVGGLVLADAFSCHVGIRWHANQTGHLVAITVPLHPQEPR